MNISQLEYLQYAVEEESYAGAAKRLYVTAQAVSRAIGELERELGIKLFEKEGRGVRPTQFAIDFCKHASEVVRDFHFLEEYAKSYTIRRGDFGIVRLAVAGSGYRGSFYSECDFDAFQRSVANASVDVQVHPSEICLSALKEKLVEAAIILGFYADEEIACTKLLSFQPVLLVPSGHKLARKKQVSIPDLDGIRLARPLDMRHNYATLMRRLEECGAKPIFVDLRGSMESYERFLREGGAVIAAKSALIAEKVGGVEPLRFTVENGLTSTLHYAYRKDSKSAVQLGFFAKRIARSVGGRL